MSARSPVHVVVLAAGRGSRLAALGEETPKWLLEVQGRTLADRHLEGVARAGEAVASTNVVVGHAAHAIESALAGRPEDVRVIPNPEYAEINNWWSLLRALRVLPDDGPMAVINSDLLVAPGAVAAFLREAAEGAADALLAVDLERQLTDESMKVSRGPGGTLARIGQVGIDDPVGEYIGLLAARGDALRRYRAALESFVDREECLNEWYEGAVGRTAAAGLGWHIWPTPSGAWVEIDDDADLAAAQSLAVAP
ncbi:MAG: NTP transferase domain-containing protein [Actinomycetes bacterium]